MIMRLVIFIPGVCYAFDQMVLANISLICVIGAPELIKRESKTKCHGEVDSPPLYYREFSACHPGKNHAHFQKYNKFQQSVFAHVTRGHICIMKQMEEFA